MKSREIMIETKTLELDHQALLDIIRTSAVLFKLSDRFFTRRGVTVAQFNVLMTINEVGEEGLSQRELSERLLVHKTNMTGLIDRLEKKGFVERKTRPGDRRCLRIVLGPNGIKVLEKVQGPYLQEVQGMMSHLTITEKNDLRNFLAKLNTYASNMLKKGAQWPPSTS